MLIIVLFVFPCQDSCPLPYSVVSPFDCDVPGDCGYVYEMIDGVVQVTGCKRNISGSETVDINGKPTIYSLPNLQEFFEDQNILLALSTHGPM